LQVDSGDLARALQKMWHRIQRFLRDESQQSVLIHNRAEQGLSVWLEVRAASHPHPAASLGRCLVLPPTWVVEMRRRERASERCLHAHQVPA
jgi:hypothetical protein